ncbi:protein of unknown function - conserved [Leishmania donovani]|uniref:Uncharacterized protein n=3 Tax=Leishmania donovani species complex TaxID=38574 RepID=A4I7H6_LEIIN|nr:conserved hypothetical protein [Leishmania infantum JPCM5]XP_003863432.1 hypothetical protein, conserved [Leishmania donovani]CAC9522763.1 hypothetical_protein_-_conserved [Leishmania infantum]AYU81553.1 hypothetical protein LdCL_320006200 [Leishmania donovani]TPP43532.1 hypothetical protein CGC21_19655 [Leishmania donovani]TPP47025.1 hypothetical protein CGC20_33400 [Leishmania donovani]CAJ1991544.1 protein of unknown function - conserved [Leishmania donovani]|eukprot:XP_001467695.1 conserved hypothetical protein [Leishmania infantum JPCM5]
MPTATARDLSGKAPLFVYLQGGERERLPTGEYIRVVAQCSGADKTVNRHDFALHNRGARLCRLLDSLLDSVDVDLKRKVDPVQGLIPPVMLPHATREGCECVFRYLELIQTRVPTLLSKPLRAPLEELVCEWEMTYLLEDCFLPGVAVETKTSAALCHTLAKRGPQTMDRVLEVAMLADFLLIEPLRDLTCALLASLALSAGSEKELLQLCGLDHVLTEEELEPLYMQLPFLRPEDGLA